MLGSKRLNEIVKADIDLHLVKLAAEGYSQNLVASVRKWSHSVFEEAVDNELIQRIRLAKWQCQPVDPHQGCEALLNLKSGRCGIRPLPGLWHVAPAGSDRCPHR